MRLRGKGIRGKRIRVKGPRESMRKYEGK